MIISRSPICYRLLAVSFCLLGVAIGRAFAFSSDNQTSNFGPNAKEESYALGAPAVHYQVQTAGGAAAASGAQGWVIVPRIDLLGVLTDNALQVSSPRQADIGSIIAPGVTVSADTSRLQLRFDYSPVLSVYTRTSSQNSMSHYVNASGLLTVIPESLFVDLRAVAGVQPIRGGFAAMNGFGLGLPQSSSLGVSIVNSAILNRGNQSQVVSAGISPYLVRDFGDYGTLRLGSSLQASSQSSVSGFGTLPFTTIGDDVQAQITMEQTARFVTGDILGRVQNVTEGRLSQTPFSSNTGTSTFGRQFGDAYSSQQIITNRTAYAINHSVTVFGTLGYQNLVYRGGLDQKVTGLVWNIGTTLRPNSDSHMTISFGRQDGRESLGFDGKYQVTSRTMVSGSYSSTLTTQLQNLQRQLDLGVLGTGGVLVDSQTGAPLVIGNNGQATQPGLFRYDVFNLSVQTTLSRDFLTLVLVSSTQRPANGAATRASTTTKTISGSWARELRSDLLLNTVISYTSQTSGDSSSIGKTLAASIGVNYLISGSLTGRLRYSYFSRQSDIATAVNQGLGRSNFSQNLVTIGFTKTF